MRIAVASDHGGFKLKTTILEYLKETGHEFEDFGTFSCDSVDYPDYALKVAEAWPPAVLTGYPHLRYRDWHRYRRQ